MEWVFRLTLNIDSIAITQLLEHGDLFFVRVDFFLLELCRLTKQELVSRRFLWSCLNSLEKFGIETYVLEDALFLLSLINEEDCALCTFLSSALQNDVFVQKLLFRLTKLVRTNMVVRLSDELLRLNSSW